MQGGRLDGAGGVVGGVEAAFFGVARVGGVGGCVLSLLREEGVRCVWVGLLLGEMGSWGLVVWTVYCV